MEFGKQLKQRRKDLNLTQADVAEKLYVTRQTVSNWEVGKNYLDLNMLIKISDVYQVSIDSLLRGDEDLKDYIDRGKASRAFDTVCAAVLIIIGLFNYNQSAVTSNVWSSLTGTAISLAGLFVILYRRKIKYLFAGESKEKYNERMKSVKIGPSGWILLISLVAIELLCLIFGNKKASWLATGTVFLLFGLFDFYQLFKERK